MGARVRTVEAKHVVARGDGPKTMAPHFSFLFGIECAGPGSRPCFAQACRHSLPSCTSEGGGKRLSSDEKLALSCGGPVARDYVNGLRMSDNGLRVCSAAILAHIVLSVGMNNLHRCYQPL